MPSYFCHHISQNFLTFFQWLSISHEVLDITSPNSFLPSLETINAFFYLVSHWFTICISLRNIDSHIFIFQTTLLSTTIKSSSLITTILIYSLYLFWFIFVYFVYIPFTNRKIWYLFFSLWYKNEYRCISLKMTAVTVKDIDDY